jgi:hypothetical protein
VRPTAKELLAHPWLAIGQHDPSKASLHQDIGKDEEAVERDLSIRKNVPTVSETPISRDSTEEQDIVMDEPHNDGHVTGSESGSC